MEEHDSWEASLQDFSQQRVIYEHLRVSFEHDTFVQTYLITGIEGSGKKTLGNLLARRLLCQGERKPCGQCSSCKQIRSGTHPDLISVRPGEHIRPIKDGKNKQGISAEDSREIVRLASKHSFKGGNRVILIEQADQMTIQAQNILLKTIEETTDSLFFLFLTEKPAALLPTIVSRCRLLKLQAWSDDAIREALYKHGIQDRNTEQSIQVAAGSIGRAIGLVNNTAYWEHRNEILHDFFDQRYRSDAPQVAAKYKKLKLDEANSLLNDLEQMLHTLLMVRYRILSQDALKEWPDSWQEIAPKASLKSLNNLLDAVKEGRAQRTSNVNWQAVVEQLMLKIMEEKNQWSML